MSTRILQFRELESSEENDNTNTDEDTICPIDRDILAPEDYIMQIIHCGHYFREQNLRRHFRRNPRCPLCRFDIRDYGLGDRASTNNSSTTENTQMNQSTQTRPNYPPPPPPSIENTPTTSNIIRDSSNSTRGNLYSNISPLHDIENPFLTRPSANINPTRQTTREINGNTITHTQSFTSDSDISGNNTVLEYSITIQPFAPTPRPPPIPTPSPTPPPTPQTLTAVATEQQNTEQQDTEQQDTEQQDTESTQSLIARVDAPISTLCQDNEQDHNENDPAADAGGEGEDVDELHEFSQHTD